MRLPAALFAILCAANLTAQQKPIFESAFLRNNDVYAVLSDSDDSTRLTTDGRRKAYLCVNQDGSLIAFAVVSGRQSLATIVVISADGLKLRETEFRPPEANVSGMRFVETFEWLTPTRLVLSGSLNPSTVEYAVVDATTGEELESYFVDGFNWKPSPDGIHAAYLNYIPHFTPEDRRRPMFCVDRDCSLDLPQGFPASDRRVEFDWSPAWSDDSRQVAILAEDLDRDRKVLLIVKRIGSKYEEFAAPPEAGHRVLISWEGSDLVVHSGELRWKINPDRSALVRTGQ